MLESRLPKSFFPQDFGQVLETSAKILARGEETKTSVRNAFFRHFTNKKVHRKFYNSVYHFCMEITRRKNLLDEYLQLSINSKKLDPFVLSLLRIGVYISHDPSYQTNPLYSFKSVQTVIREILQKKF
ncbi:MAG: hypothetical protein ACFFBD_21535, partial [Candidatus Hodarchaeota archaeon]